MYSVVTDHLFTTHVAKNVEGLEWPPKSSETSHEQSINALYVHHFYNHNYQLPLHTNTEVMFEVVEITNCYKCLCYRLKPLKITLYHVTDTYVCVCLFSQANPM